MFQELFKTKVFRQNKFKNYLKIQNKPTENKSSVKIFIQSAKLCTQCRNTGDLPNIGLSKLLKVLEFPDLENDVNYYSRIKTMH